MMQLELKVDPSIRAALRRAEPAQLRRLLQKLVRPGAKPALEAVKAGTPVLSGKLRASWGMRGFFDRRTGSVGVSIEPRSTFTYSDMTKWEELQGPGLLPEEIAKWERTQSSLSKTLVTRRGRAHKSVKSAIARGRAVDRQDPWKYAFGIETGRSPKGRMTRHAGGAKMLERGASAGARQFFTTVTDGVSKHIAAGTL